MDIVFTFLLGVLLRLGLPIAVTAILLLLLRRLDKRWQKEALALPVVPVGVPCWEIKDCPEQTKKYCPASLEPRKPCWQIFREKDGVMKEACLSCAVFRQAPAPVRA
jgi:hypothetical protein